MLSNFILLIYHAVSGLRRTGINFVHQSAEAASCWCLAVCSRTLLISPSMSGERDRVHVHPDRKHFEHLLRASYYTEKVMDK